MGAVLSSIGSILSYLFGASAAGEDSASDGQSGVTAFHSSARWQLHFNSIKNTNQLVTQSTNLSIYHHVSLYM
jgi:thioredoxin 1